MQDPEIERGGIQVFVDSTIQDGHTLPVRVLQDGELFTELFVRADDGQNLFLQAAGSTQISVVGVHSNGQVAEFVQATQRSDQTRVDDIETKKFLRLDENGLVIKAPPSSEPRVLIPRGGRGLTVQVASTGDSIKIL